MKQYQPQHTASTRYQPKYTEKKSNFLLICRVCGEECRDWADWEEGGGRIEREEERPIEEGQRVKVLL